MPPAFGALLRPPGAAKTEIMIYRLNYKTRGLVNLYRHVVSYILLHPQLDLSCYMVCRMTPKFIELLLNYDADPRIKDNKGITPYDRANARPSTPEWEEIRELLRKKIELLDSK